MQAVVRYIVTNRSLTLLLLLIVGVAAWIKLPQLRISQYPVVELPTLMIYATLPGASANEIEQRIIRPVEEKLQNIRNLDTVVSDIYGGYAWVTITYNYGVDVDDEYVEVNARINNIKAKLPADAEVVVQKRSPVDFIVSFVLGVTSETASPDELRQASQNLSQSLRNLKSIEDIEEIQADQVVEINIDIPRMERSNLSLAAITQAIRGNNQYLPTGVFDVGQKALSVLAFGSGYKSLDELRETMVINREGRALAIKDVADVYFAHERGTTVPRIAGSPAVFVTMKLSADANIFAARREIQEVIDEQSLTDDLVVEWLFDAEAGVDAKLNELGLNVLQGVGILALVLLFAVGYRSALIISLMLPAALFMSLVGLAFTNYGVQEISLAGFIIALGLIVDNGIVVTENAYKLNHYDGYSHPESAILGTSSVIMPLLSSTATTALAFAPLFLLTSDTGLFLHSLVAVIWLCLAASLVAAVVISSILIARMGTEPTVRFLPRLPNFLVALIPFRDGVYRRAVFYFIQYPWRLALLVLALFVLTGFAATRLTVIVFPESEDPYFTVDIKAPLDRNRSYLESLTHSVTNEVLALDGVQQCSSVQGGSFPMVNTGASRVAVRRTNAQLFCSVDFRDAAELADLIREVNQRLEAYSAQADIRAASFAVGSGTTAGDIEIHLRGQSILTLRETAIQLEEYILQAGIDGMGDLVNDASSRYFALKVEFDRRRASAIGVDRSSVDQVLVMMMYGAQIDSLRHPDGRDYDIILRTESASEDPLNVFDRIYVRSSTGANVPLSQVVNVSFTEDEYDILHDRFKPRVSLQIFADDSVPINELTSSVQTAVSNFSLPEGVEIDYGGALAQQADSFGGLGKYIGIIALVVLAIFVFQFGSLIQPLVICAAIPLSFIGAFLLLYLTNEAMSFLAFIGLTSLMGIVINNSILLVDEGNQLRDSQPQLSIAEVAVAAGTNRFMPILLTSITSMAGLLPLALGDSMFKSLSLAVIGGLATSTFLTLICVPVLYAFTTRRKNNLNPAATAPEHSES